MAVPRPRATSGDPEVDAVLGQLLAANGSDANDDLIRSLLITALEMDKADIDRLELKIASQTMVEMLRAWQVFAPYASRAKVTIFGSARIKPGQPDYELAVAFGRRMAERDWMAITGAGPGIMTAGMEGIGVDRSFGVNILLPFEQQAAALINRDPKLATFKYFFTRKLTFMKESDAFALFPGGYGTLDEAFELITLVQTGKSYPVPIVLLDHPGSTYWRAWEHFIESQLLEPGLIGPNDLDLFLHTHDPDEAAEYLCAFYSCYHSLRFVGRRLILRLRSPVPPDALADLNREFADIVVKGEIEPVEATEAERRDGDQVDLPRLALHFDDRSFARLVLLIRRVNEVAGRPGADAARNLLHDVAPDMPAEAVGDTGRLDTGKLDTGKNGTGKNGS
jgi:uncharacterized protein (TIGR00730 family)